jgi:hypothetical protein
MVRTSEVSSMTGAMARAAAPTPEALVATM